MGELAFRTFNLCVGVFLVPVVVSLGKLTAGHEDYYEREVAGGAEDYYRCVARRRGSGRRWRRGVGPRRLCDGRSAAGVVGGCDPATGEMLRSRPVHVTGWDVTYSPPNRFRFWTLPAIRG